MVACCRVCATTLAALLLYAAPATALPVTFSGPTQRATAAAPRTIAIADFNADGDPDVAVPTEGVDQVAVFLGSAATTFSGPTPFTVGDAPRGIAVGNFDGGAILDLAVANWNADTVSILLGGAGPLFGTKTDLGAGNGPRAVAVGLFNAGVDPDLAVANEFSDDVSVLIGGTGGTFAAALSYATGGSPSAVAIADFNADADPDLAVANLATDNVSILLGGAGGTFGAATNLPAGNGPRSIAVADFNGDGDPDLAVASENSDDVSILLGGAGASFAAAISVPAGNGPRAVLAADVTRDGDLDLAVANSESDNVSVLPGGPGASFMPALHFPAGNEPFSIATADFDGDGELDLVASNHTSDDISIYRNTTAPETTIDSGPAGASADATPTVTFSADEPGATFACRVDGAAFAPCASPFTTAVLPDGAHSFEVRATDPAGNADATPASRAFTIDATAPDTTIGAGASGAVADATPTFEFGASEGATFECRLDGAAFAGCASPFTTAQLADGGHSFEVRAIDAVGNADATPASRAFTIDTAAPETTILAGPTGTVVDLNPTFGFASSEPGSTFACRIDAAAFVACSSPYTTPKLTPGPHSFEVRATDIAGNSDAGPARRAFTAVFRITSAISHDWQYRERFTTVKRLAVEALAPGASVQVRCRGRGCPFARKSVKPNARRVAAATKLFRGKRLRPGTEIEVRVTARYAIGKVRRFRIRSNKVPKRTDLCLRPGASTPTRC